MADLPRSAASAPVSIGARLLLAVLWGYDLRGERFVWPTVERLAADTAQSVRTVKRQLAELVADQWVERGRERVDGRARRGWRLHEPDERARRLLITPGITPGITCVQVGRARRKGAKFGTLNMRDGVTAVTKKVPNLALSTLKEERKKKEHERARGPGVGGSEPAGPTAEPGGLLAALESSSTGFAALFRANARATERPREASGAGPPVGPTPDLDAAVRRASLALVRESDDERKTGAG